MIKALRENSPAAPYKKGDVLVLFGELFARGYANGIVDEAEKHGMKIIRTTVGRRDADGKLRPLNPQEMESQPQPFINVPLEAGFDFEPSSKGQSPADQLAGIKMNDWDAAKLDWVQVNESLESSRLSFQKRVQQYLVELKKHIEPGRNVLFVHTMAGGVPRAKIMMPTMNRVFKVRGDKFTESEIFWNTELGKLCAMNFSEVTARTFQVLLDETTSLRKDIQSSGGNVSYVAYGYHGTEVMIENKYQWQSYSPYVQGWAKIELENYAKQAFEKGIHASVFNCPEILTNSSSIFQGLEVSLYPLLGALKKEGNKSEYVQKLLKACLARFKDGVTVEKVLTFTDQYLTAPIIKKHCQLEKWPQHNSREQMELMIKSSDELQSWHKDEKELCNFLLSEEVFKATGTLMFNESFSPKAPVWWIGHDVLAKTMAENAD